MAVPPPDGGAGFPDWLVRPSVSVSVIFSINTNHLISGVHRRAFMTASRTDRTDGAGYQGKRRVAKPMWKF